MRIWWMVLAALGVLVMAPAAEAARAELPFAKVQTISDANGAQRVLVDPGDLSAFRDELILSAFLEFSLPGNVPAEDLDIAVHAVTTPWTEDARVTWSSPWTRPGGDLEEDYYDSLTLRKGRAAATLQLDVTDSIRSMADGTLAANGFVLIPAEDGKVGFTSGDAGILGALTGKLVVSYRVVSVHGLKGSDRR